VESFAEQHKKSKTSFYCSRFCCDITSGVSVPLMVAPPSHHNVGRYNPQIQRLPCPKRNQVCQPPALTALCRIPTACRARMPTVACDFDLCMPCTYKGTRRSRASRGTRVFALHPSRTRIRPDSTSESSPPGDCGPGPRRQLKTAAAAPDRLGFAERTVKPRCGPAEGDSETLHLATRRRLKPALIQTLTP
jgi:hypothetical protein